eukprot:1136973-Pelagomonas_calceolata.AAC.12
MVKMVLIYDEITRHPGPEYSSAHARSLPKLTMVHGAPGRDQCKIIEELAIPCLGDVQAERGDPGAARGRWSPLTNALTLRMPIFSRPARTHAQAATDITHSIVRPTAFFKSVAGQVQLIKDGAPFVMFGDGTLAACKPISEANLASFIADCVVQRDKVWIRRGCLCYKRVLHTCFAFGVHVCLPTPYHLDA